MVYIKNISFARSLLLSALLVISGPVSAFDLGKLKDLAEQLQKDMPAPNKKDSGNNSSNSPAMQNFQAGSSSKSANTGKLAFCDGEGSGFNTSLAKSFNVGDPEALVKQYFDLDPTTATVELRFLVREYISPVVGTSFIEATTDGGILSGEVRALGIKFFKTPNIANLAQIIAAAGQKKQGFGAVDLQVYEHKALFALVALQLENILKQPNIIPQMLKESRKKGKYFKLATAHSQFAYGLSARYEFEVTKSRSSFDSFLTRSNEDPWAGDSDTKGNTQRDDMLGCVICRRTFEQAARAGVGEWPKRYQQGLQLKAKMDEGRRPFDDPNWLADFQRLDAKRRQLDQLTKDTFKAAKTTARSVSVGREATLKSAKAAALGMEENPFVKEATSIVLISTPTFADAEKKRKLQQIMRERMRTYYFSKFLHEPLENAFWSGDYSIGDLGYKGRDLAYITMATCLSGFAEQEAVEASGDKMPDENDVKAETDSLRDL